ncbi:hypothetical protein SAMN05880582_106212 [Rhizobium sp. RU20A]|uniref:hypothetical protein n=1 Tax=Rhizobium sp. RU20A TaxID=1907412 RepID=UPI000955D8B9|nr:hypothetical protein [Rhizobium sp. RU20A]SIR10954.1 hypothetical protein SAMN05880582_106212 [Rhizobium sp. RU20A]
MLATPQASPANTAANPAASGAVAKSPSPQAAVRMPVAAEPQLKMDLIAFELALDGFSGGGAEAFVAHVRRALPIGGAFLFDLPASGLIAGCMRIAVVRVGGEAETLFVCLEEDGLTIRTLSPGPETAGLARFADAFLDVIGQI